MNEFKNYHPIINFIYFLFVIGFSCVFMHPICLFISLFSGLIYSLVQKGFRGVKKKLIYLIPLMLFTALINPAFNHRGLTVITYLPTGNPLTLESIIYGLFTAVMLASVILWFSSYNEVMTSDKFIYLFGKVIPSLSLILSMTLRFVPRFLSQMKSVLNAGKCMGRDVSKGSVIKRAKNALSVLSVMTTWALENAIETADSMKARGYGLPGRTAFSIYTFDKRDKKAFFIIMFLGLYVLFGGICGSFDFTYFPEIKNGGFTFFDLSIFMAYLLLFVCPVIIELWEVRRWKLLRSKI